MNNKSMSKSDRPLEFSIAQERLRQAQYSFNLALTAIALSLLISVIGAMLLLSGKVEQGAVIPLRGSQKSKACTASRHFDYRPSTSLRTSSVRRFAR